MKACVRIAILTATAFLLAACGSGAGKSSPSASQPAAAPSAAAPMAATAAATTLAPAATPTTNPVDRITGTVQSVTGVNIMLTEGGSFMLGPQTIITRRVSTTQRDLQAGKVVAITAKRQPDNTLLASLIVVFPAAPSGSFFGQRPEGDSLMTNATIDKVTGNSFAVTFPGGGAQVSLAPGAKLLAIVRATEADLREGTSVSVSVQDGVAQSVSIP